MENTPEENVEIESKTEEIAVKEKKPRKPRAKKVEPEIILTDKVEPTISYSKLKALVRQPREQSEKQKQALANLVAKNKQRKIDRLNEEQRQVEAIEEKLKEEAKALKAYRVRPKKPHAKKKPIVKKEIEEKKAVESADENDDYDSDPETTDTRVIRKTISKIEQIDKTISSTVQSNPYAELLKRHYL